jgi:hypothetical protein
MARYDIEQFLDAIESVLKPALASKITAINSEKNDTTTLSSIASGAWFQQTLNKGVASYDPYVLYGITDIETVGLGPASSKVYSIHIMIMLADEGKPDIVKRVLRYQRALEEVAHENFDLIRVGLKLKISSLVPVQIEELNSGRELRALGIQVQVAMA